MGTTLTGSAVRDTYDSLIKVTDNGPLSGTAKRLTDGLGNDSALALSTAQVQVGGGSIGLNYPLTIRSNPNDYTKILDWGTDAGGSWGTMTINLSSPYETILKSGEWVFNTGSTERMRITSAGYVGIGTSAPNVPLEILSNASANALRLRARANDDYSFIQFANNASNAILGEIFSYRSGTNIAQLGFSTANGAGSIERMTISPAGNVGIGTNSPDSNLHIKNTSSNAKVTIETADAYDAYINFSAASGEWSMGYDRTSDDLIFCAADNLTTNERIRFTSDGITFNGDTAAANALDDYEEGTWTPSAAGLTLNYTVTSSVGYYTKIGNVVTVSADISWTSANVGPASSTFISNLPFTVNANSYYAGSVGYITSTAAVDQFVARADANSTSLYIIQRINGSAMTDAPATIWGATNRLIATVTYFV